MACGSHHHLKRLTVPKQWNLDKKSGKYALRPLPGPHSKFLSIPLGYVLSRFLKVANTAKEIEYITNNKMVTVNGRDVNSVKFPVGLFDVITFKKTNQHFRIYFGANGKFKLHSISSDEAMFRLSKVISKHSHEGYTYTHTMDGYNFNFADPAINLQDTVKINIKTNEIVANFALETGKLAYTYSGPHCGRIGTVIRIDVAIDLKKTIFIQDKLGKIFHVSSNDVMVIGENNSTYVAFDENDGVRLTSFEISNKHYAKEAEVEAEDN